MFLFNVFQTNNINSENNQNGRPVQIDNLDSYLFHRLSQNLLGAAEPAPATLPTPPPPPPGAEQPKVIDIGDVNNDGKIDEQDYTELLKLVDKKKEELSPKELEQFERADLNKDDTITDKDKVLGSKLKLSDASILHLRIIGHNAQYGDFNCDGLVDSADLDIVQKYVKWVDNPDDKTNTEVRLSEKEKKIIGDTKDARDKYIENLKKRLYEIKPKGDINGDGVIDEKDVEFARQGFLTAKEKEACDVDDNAGFDKDKDIEALNHLLIDKVEGDINGDGKIDGADLKILIEADGKMHLLSKAQMKAAGIDSYDKTEIKEAIKKLGKRLALQKTGDVNGDGVLTEADYAALDKIIHDVNDKKWILTDAEKVAFDFDGDSRVDEDDVTTLTKRFDPKVPQSGDIDGDGKVTYNDYKMLELYLNGGMLLTEEEMKAANMDGNVDSQGHQILLGPDQIKELPGFSSLTPAEKERWLTEYNDLWNLKQKYDPDP